MENPNVLLKLLTPVSSDQFITSFWQREPCFFDPAPEPRLDFDFTFEDFEELLGTNRLSDPRIRVVRKGQEFDESVVDENGAIRGRVVSQALKSGYSLVIHGLERLVPSIALFAQNLQLDFSAKVRVNAYFTPGSGQALNPHYDSHDVFVMQTDGSKEWRVYDEAVFCPLDGTVQPHFKRCNLPEPLVACLQNGDLLYIPKGWVHEAETTGEPSLHLTVGIHPVQWVDFVSKALLALSLAESEFRRSLPVGFLRGGVSAEALQNRLDELVLRLLEKGSAEQALSVIQDDFVREFRLGLNQKEKRSITSIRKASFCKDPSIYCRLIYSPDRVGIQFSNKIVTCSRKHTDALEFITNTTGNFSLEDIPNLPVEEAGALLCRLYDEELLILSDDKYDLI